ncbi:MAG: PEP-utilizing enzyme [Pseudonocardiaceae bacterium]
MTAPDTTAVFAEAEQRAFVDVTPVLRAREYGIPAVVGAPDATTRITTGQQIHHPRRDGPHRTSAVHHDVSRLDTRIRGPGP